MLPRNSIAKTKRFFHKTIELLKSFFSGEYERLPKIPPFNPCSCTAAGSGDTSCRQSFRELGNLYGDFTNRWESSDPDKKKQQVIDKEEIYGGSFLKFGKQSPAKIRHEEERRTQTQKEMRRSHGSGEDIGFHGHSESNVRESGDQLVVVQKLKELEMMDASDMEHVLDIEEVLHYYSRLTCPAYLDIVNRFFMDTYSDLFLPQPSSEASSSSANNSTHRV